MSFANNRVLKFSDYLAKAQEFEQKTRAQQFANKAFTPKYIFPAEDLLDLSDSVTPDNDTEAFSDTLQLPDSETTALQLTREFQFTDSAGGGTGVTQPLQWRFGNFSEGAF